MGTFAYIARDSAGKRITGTLTGQSEHAVLAELYARELAPVSVDEVRERVSLRLGRPVSTRKLANLYRQLADLLRSGVPLLRSLRLLGRGKSNPALAKIMTDVADAVADGERLADAMAAKPEVFPDVHIAMVRAGETGGFLEAVLARLGDFLEHQADLKSKVIGNLIYPIVLLTLAIGVVVAAMIFFVPKFEPMFAKLDSLPLPTVMLLAISDGLREQTIVILLVLAALIALALWGVRRPEFRRWLAGVVIRLPKVGEFSSQLAIARFTRILGTMLGNGIPMLAAMKISRDAAGNPILAEAIDAATENVRAGETLAEPLAHSGMIADDIIEMISVGEAANNLPDVLITISDTIEKRIDRTLALLLRLMEPALLLFLAGVVVFIFLALFLPMLKMSTAIGN